MQGSCLLACTPTPTLWSLIFFGCAAKRFMRRVNQAHWHHQHTKHTRSLPPHPIHLSAGVGTVIDPSSDTADLAPGTRLDLPLWMVPPMAGRNMLQARVLGLFVLHSGRVCHGFWACLFATD